MEVFGGDGGRDRRGMGSLYMSRVGAPASSFERGSAEEAIVNGEQALSDTICNLGKIARPELVGD